MTTKNSILVVGESCLDVFTYGSCIRLCPEAPVPIFNPTKTIENGGMAFNVYKNLESLGASSQLFTNENHKRISKTRFIDENTNHMFMRLDKNDRAYGKCKVEKIDFSLYDAVIISDYNKGFLSEGDIAYIGESHDMVFLDTKKILGSWCEAVNYIKININEYERTKHMLNETINNKLIITRGSAGASHGGVTYPVPQVEIKDTSGAGDTFIAALAVEYTKSQKIEKAILFANECATMVVQKKGVSTV